MKLIQFITSLNSFRFVPIFSFVFVIGCASPVYNVSSVTSIVNIPPVGEESTAYIGDELIYSGSKITNAFLSVKEYTPLGMFGMYQVGEGLYRKTGEDSKSIFYDPVNEFDGGGVMTKSALADPRKAVQAYKNKKKLCGVTVFNLHVCKSNAKYEFVSKSIEIPGSHRKVLIYNGKTGTKIHVGYQKVSNDELQAGVTNIVSYDLLESKIIGYKGARIEVIKASNELIQYKVLNHFSSEVN